MLTFPKMGWTSSVLLKVTWEDTLSILSSSRRAMFSLWTVLVPKKQAMRVKFRIILMLEAIFPVSAYIFTEGSCNGSDIPSARIPVLSWLFRNDHKSDPSGSAGDGNWMRPMCRLFCIKIPRGKPKATYVNSWCPVPQTRSSICMHLKRKESINTDGRVKMSRLYFKYVSNENRWPCPRIRQSFI